LQIAIKELYGDDPEKSANYARIVNERHFIRLKNLLQHQKTKCPDTVIIGGKSEAKTHYFAPTVVVVSEKSPYDCNPVMEEEVFGPILTVVTVNDINEAISIVNTQ
jgi:aldehyde dehydrogenase (NAD+)